MLTNWVLIDITVHARGEMATKLLEAAELLGLPVAVVKTTTEGFRVPVEIHWHLFPSQYEEIVHTEEVPDGDVAALAAAMGAEVVTAAQLDALKAAEFPDTRYTEFDFTTLRAMAKGQDLSGSGTAEDLRARLREHDDAQ